MNELKIGDRVELKSGGPTMTIIEIDSGNSGWLRCCWFTNAGAEKTSREFFPPESLKYIG